MANQSEFTGETQRNTVFPKPEEAVKSTDLLRLIYVTGTEQIDAPPDPQAFTGGKVEMPPPVA